MVEVINWEISKGRVVTSAESAVVRQCINKEAEWAWDDLAFAVELQNHPYSFRDDREILEAVETWRSATAMRALVKGDRELIEMIWGEPKTMRCEVANF